MSPFHLLQKFYPKMIYDENSEVDENELKSVISKSVVSDAISIYNLLKKKGTGNKLYYKYFIL